MTATRGNGQVTVGFAAPASDGGSAITQYTATSNPGNFTGSCTAPCASITVSGLANGTAYTFTVTATNAVGTGPASAASAAVTPATVPGRRRR
ncbi:MAG: fibronectin type III domain-containing protein [Betaproteobacteria bacterium]|nr:fibronectin type III domain-containing protein [Betaproteobacteria bacterium]